MNKTTNDQKVPLNHFKLDMAEVEMVLESRREAERLEQIREINEHDLNHCRVCNAVSLGCDIAGNHVQICDSCLIQWVQEQIAR